MGRKLLSGGDSVCSFQRRPQRLLRYLFLSTSYLQQRADSRWMHWVWSNRLIGRSLSTTTNCKMVLIEIASTPQRMGAYSSLAIFFELGNLTGHLDGQCGYCCTISYVCYFCCALRILDFLEDLGCRHPRCSCCPQGSPASNWPETHLRNGADKEKVTACSCSLMATSGVSMPPTSVWMLAKRMTVTRRSMEQAEQPKEQDSYDASSDTEDDRQ